MLTPSKAPLLQLRDYQHEAVEAVFDWFCENDGSPIVVAPTGSGKSLLLAEFIRRAHEIYPGTRFIVLAHIAELLKQDASAIIGQWPDCDLTFYSDKIGSKDLSGQVVVASIQSIYKQAYNFRAPVPELVIIDEAHLLSNKDGSMYRKFLSDLAMVNPDIKCVGFTATPFRRGTGLLHKGENALFTGIAYEIGILDLINQGYLLPVITPTMQTRMDVTGVKVQGGDYVQSQLEKAVDTDPLTEACVDEILEYSHGRKRWLVFTAGVKHCEHVRDEIRRRGIACEMVTGKTPVAERNKIVNWHKEKSEDTRCLVNVAVFSTGFDNPAIDLMASLRPTKSPVLYIQTTGRGMRPYPGKTDCLLLDMGGTVENLGPIDRVRLPKKKNGPGEAPTKTCPECGETCHAAARVCMTCQYEFPEPELKIDKHASNAAVLSTQLKTECYAVTSVNYFLHQKEGKPDSLRVEYLCGILSFREWVLLESSGPRRELACFWWRQRSDGKRAPNKIAEALSRIGELKKPMQIHVKKVGKYFEVVGADL